MLPLGPYLDHLAITHSTDLHPREFPLSCKSLCRLLHGFLAPTALLSVDQYVLVCIPEPYSLCVPTPTVADCLNALHIYSGTLLPAGLTTSDQLWYDEN